MSEGETMYDTASSSSETISMVKVQSVPAAVRDKVATSEYLPLSEIAAATT